MPPPRLSTPGTKPEPEIPVAPPAPAPAKPTPGQGKVVISPEMVCFRTADEVCSTCDHFGQDGQCAVLNMVVESGDSCNAWAPREDGASDLEEQMEQAPAAV